MQVYQNSYKPECKLGAKGSMTKVNSLVTFYDFCNMNFMKSIYIQGHYLNYAHLSYVSIDILQSSVNHFVALICLLSKGENLNHREYSVRGGMKAVTPIKYFVCSVKKILSTTWTTNFEM